MLHQQDIIHERLALKIGDKFKEIADKKHHKCRYYCGQFWNNFIRKVGLKSKLPYINYHLIDDFIDDYWRINIPESLNIVETNDRVFGLIHYLFMIGEEL